MKKKSKCIKCDFTKEFETKGGATLYNFIVGFENGENGTYTGNDKEKPKFRVGEEAEYTTETQEFNGMSFLKIKPFYENKGGYNKQANQRGIFACTSLNKAVEFTTAKYGAESTVEQVKFHATQFFNWLNDMNDGKTPSC